MHLRLYRNHLKSINKVFITASFENAENKKEIEELCFLVKAAGFIDFCFIRDVENYQKVFDNPKDLMDRALEEIKNCDYLLIDRLINLQEEQLKQVWLMHLVKK